MRSEKFVTDLFRLVLLTNIIIIQACSLTSVIPLKILRPGEITLPDSINRIALVKRTKPVNRTNKVINILEGLVTGEEIYGDRNGANACMNGLKNTMMLTPRFDVSFPVEDNMESTGTGRSPQPFDAKKIEELCNKYQVDAIVVLEAFDSDQSTAVSSKETVNKDKDGKEIKYLTYHARRCVKLTTCWRIYYPFLNKPVDEFSLRNTLEYSGEGITETAATNNIPNSGAIVNNAGYAAGRAYAFRISPQWISVPREYYRSGNEEMKKAATLVNTNHWEQAIEIWKQQLKNPDKKIAGRAAYNMAVACEFDENLDLALVWAQKSKTEFGNKNARFYITLLESHIYESEKLKKQMKTRLE